MRVVVFLIVITCSISFKIVSQIPRRRARNFPSFLVENDCVHSIDCSQSHLNVDEQNMDNCIENNIIDIFRNDLNANAIILLSTAAAIISNPQGAEAVDGAYGVLEGKWAGLLHPLYFLGLYATSIAAAFQGIKWRKARGIIKQIKDLRETSDATLQVMELQKERDRLLSDNPKDKHVSLGSLILGSGIAMALEGALSTFWRVGELFPDVHLFSGLALVIIWASSYSLAPLMVKGNETARNAHFALNVLGLLIFTSQILSGWDIMINVWNEVPGW